MSEADTHADAPPRIVFPFKAAARWWESKGEVPDLSWLVFDKPRGLCGDYVKIAEHVTDARWAYHEACFWTVVGVAFGRKVSVQMGPTKIFANFFTCLVGPSSRARKTTSIDIAAHLAKLLGVKMLPVDVTPERLFAILVEKPRGVLACREFSSFMTTARKQYGQGLIEMILELYDCPDEMCRSTKGGGDETINMPFVSILAASTPQMLRVAFTTVDVTGGLVPRFLLVCRPEARGALEMQPAMELDKMGVLAKSIMEKVPSDEADDVCLEFDAGAMAELTPMFQAVHAYATNLIRMSGEAVAERLKQVLIKVSALSAMLRGSDKIRELDVQEAAGFVLRILCGHDIINNIFWTEGIFAELVVRVEEVLTEKGQMTRRQLSRAFYPSLSRKKMEAILMLMEDAGFLEVIKPSKDEEKTRGQPMGPVYRWKGPRHGG